MRSHGALLLAMLAGGLVCTIGLPADDRSRATHVRQSVAQNLLPWDVVFTEIPAARAARVEKSGFTLPGEGGRLVLLGRDRSQRVLTPQFHSAADAAVSFDGKRILFAGKHTAGGRWAIYEMNADGTGVRRIAGEPGDCREPIYQSPIFYLDDPGPMPQIAFVSTAPETAPEYGGVPATSIYSSRMDGSGMRRLTYNPSGAFDPAMLPDGRMLFSGWDRGRIELLATNIDGTDYATFSGGQGGRMKRMACVTAKRLVLFVETAAPGDGAGPLGVIDLRRNLRSYRPLRLPPAHVYYSPSPLPDGSVLLSRRLATGRGTYGIVRFDPETGKLDRVFASPAADAIQAQALVPRAVPDGRSSVVDDKQPWARLYCLNLYETDVAQRSWPKGLVKRIRLVEGLPEPAGDVVKDAASPLLHTRFLGEFDADEDGSFHAQIPANLPVKIQALDENGMALRSSAWIWAKNKEQRGCIGCHEDGERTPENIMASALTRPAADLMLPAERRRTVEFERDVAPILRRSCATAACHGGSAQPRLPAYEGLMAKNPRTGRLRYVTPGAARTSPLVWALFGGNTSRPWDHPRPGAMIKRMPPAPAAPLSAEEKRAVVEWIDLGAHYHGLPQKGGQP
jgi:hypothetical protein